MLTTPKNAHASPSSLMLRGPFYFDPLAPDPKAITLAAVAAGLEEPRWLSQTTRTITVAEHLIRCARIATARGGTFAQVLACKMHDCGESVMRDLPGPFKRHVFVQLPDGNMVPYSHVEGRVCAAIVEALVPDERLRDEVLELLEEPNGFVHAVDRDAEAIEALRWLDGGHDWALRREVSSIAWAVADVPPECSWSAWFSDTPLAIWTRFIRARPDASDMQWTDGEREHAFMLLRKAIGLS